MKEQKSYVIHNNAYAVALEESCNRDCLRYYQGTCEYRTKDKINCPRFKESYKRSIFEQVCLVLK